MIDRMSRFRGRASLTIMLTIILALLVITYHLLSSEVDEASTSDAQLRSNVDKAHSFRSDGYGLSDLTESPADLAKRLQYRARLLDKSRNDENRKNYEDRPSGEALFEGHKIVHLDLKGAPFLVGYYGELFRLLRKLGATGILLEYEDMFPYGGNIANISAKNCYSRRDIATIRRLASENDLAIVPLIQTFGHLEFVLKLGAYKDYREIYRYPQVICPTYEGTESLIREMIDQVAAAHPDAKYLHIGADEVYHIGECARCSDTMAKNQWGKRQLFLAHVTKIARYIKKKYPRIGILMWDDEFRDISSREIRESGLERLIEPVVWKYTSDPASSLNDQLWENYAAVWPAVWIATAFKGATEPDRYYTDISYHMENHRGWLEIMSKYSGRIKFKGAMLTGWQRYDHFSVLCELLPVAIPSLAVNLAILQSSTLDNNFPVELPSRISKILQCDGSVSLSIPEPQYGWTRCNFRGVKIYSAILRLSTLQQEITRMEEDSTFKGWLKPYNVEHAFSNPSHVEHAVVELDRFKMDVMYIEREIRDAMDGIYDAYTIDEWLETFVAPLNDKVTKLWDAKEKILAKHEWPRRPIAKSEF